MRPHIIIVLTCLAFILLARPAEAQELAPGLVVSPDSNTVRRYPELAPAPSLRFHLGEVIGLRDIQGGHPPLNALDIGAGNAEQPGVLGLGADVTGELRFHARDPGQEPVRLATMTPGQITFHVPVVFGAPSHGATVKLLRRHLRRHHAR